jgi:hypothetical protein
LLWRIRPEALLLVVPDPGLTAAARELGSAVVELQHGHTHRDEPAVSWGASAVSFKPRMPLPHRMFLYGEHYRRELAAHGFWSDELRAVGSVRVDQYRRMPSRRNPARGTVVLTTQGLDTDRLIAFLLDFLRLPGESDFRLLIVPHPFHDQSIERYRKEFAAFSQVEVSTPGRPTTFELLKAADLHVSIYSTCHYEALALGVPTVILPLRGAENVRHLHEQGHAMLAETPSRLREIVLEWRTLRVPAGVGEDYFTPGALENTLHELTELHREALT